MGTRLESLTRLGFAAALTLLGACSPGMVAGPEPTPSGDANEPGHIPYDAKKVAITTAQAVTSAQKMPRKSFSA